MEADQLSAKFHEIVSKRQYRKAPHLVDTNYDALEVLVHDIKPGSIDRIVTDQEEVGEQLKEKGYEVFLCSYMAGDIERRYRFRHYLSEVFKRKIFMKSGGFLYIEQTEAMAVIDVNTGKSIGKKNQEAHIKKINLEAAKEAARQIRLRNLSGIIMIDFIDMKSKDDEKELLQVMQHYLNGDSKKAVAVDITKLGIMEITEKNEKNPIFRQISIGHIEIVLLLYMSMPHSEVKECENHQSWRDLIIGGAVMYAIIATGGKQYKVSEGDVIKVEKLDAEVGAKVTFDNVLLVGGDTVKVGTPTVDGAES